MYLLAIRKCNCNNYPSICYKVMYENLRIYYSFIMTNVTVVNTNIWVVVVASFSTTPLLTKQLQYTDTTHSTENSSRVKLLLTVLLFEQ